jgi:hypothetical protein
MVLTDADFGRAYLTEGWARRFLVDLFRSFTVLFIGYSHDDVVMHYLSRALPIGESVRRYALIANDAKSDEWVVRGIEPIIFEKPVPGDYSLLNDGISKLADNFSANLLDRKKELIALSSGPPPSDEESEDYILDNLEEVSTTRFFTQAARDPLWLKWLDDRKVFDPLFVDGELQEKDSILGTWLAEKFAINHPEELILLLGAHHMCLNPRLWRKIGREVGYNEEVKISKDALAKWVSVLLNTKSTIFDKYLLLEIAARCAGHEDTNSLLQIFSSMTSAILEVKKGFDWGEPEADPKSVPLNIEFPLATDHWGLNEFYTKFILPNQERLALPIFSISVRKLEELHISMVAWGKGDYDWDGLSYHRSAIEPHEQDRYRYPDAVDILIDAARDSFIYLNQMDSNLSEGLLDIISKSSSPILRRIVIHVLTERTGLTADKKLEKFLSSFALHDRYAHHEVFRFVASIYPKLSKHPRSKLIKEIWAFTWPDKNDENFERATAHERYNWFQWLAQADQECELIKNALAEILEKFPESSPREHPDFTSWVSSGGAEWIGDRSPWSVEELLSKSPSEWITDLLSFKGNSFLGPDRDGLIILLTEAAKQEIQWGLELANELEQHGGWESDLWRGLFRAWEEWSPDKTQCKTIVEWLQQQSLWEKYHYYVAQDLYALVREEGKECTLEILSDANKIASDLWPTANKIEDYPETSDDWIQLAINRTPGVIAEFWLRSIVHWRKNQDPKPENLSEEYRQELDKIIQDHNDAGGIALSVLASQFAFFLSVDYDWAVESLLPWFDPENDSKRFQQSWHGFLISGNLNLNVFEKLSPFFEKALTTLDNELASKKDRFIEFLTVMFVFYIPNPLEKWIPLLFQNLTIEDRKTWSMHVAHMLRGMTEEQQQELWDKWLEQYWLNRLQGLPQPIDQSEVSNMLEWLPKLAAVFPNAVDIAIQMPQVPSQHLSTIYTLKNSDIVERYQESTVKLLVYLLHQGTPLYAFHGLNDILAKIDRDVLEPGLNQQLTERLEVMGFSQ